MFILFYCYFGMSHEHDDDYDDDNDYYYYYYYNCDTLCSFIKQWRFAKIPRMLCYFIEIAIHSEKKY